MSEVEEGKKTGERPMEGEMRRPGLGWADRPG
jgi:hypothetical protein